MILPAAGRCTGRVPDALLAGMARAHSIATVVIDATDQQRLGFGACGCGPHEERRTGRKTKHAISQLKHKV